MGHSKNLFPHNHYVNSTLRKKLIKQRPLLIWLSGLSGSGKSTIANELEKKLYENGCLSYLLDGDNITTKSPKVLGGGRFDLSNTPDLLPALAILCLKSSKPIEIFNVKHARYKETDRISVISRELKKLVLG